MKSKENGKWIGKFLGVAAAVLFAASPAMADSAKVSGFADIIYTITDDAGAKVAGKSTTESKFGVTGEVDYENSLSDKVDVRVDLDLDAAGATSFEQAYFTLKDTVGPLTLTGGIFNSPVGWELQDAPDMCQTSWGQLFNLVPGNLTGIKLDGKAGVADVTVGFVNDINGANEENSIVVTVGASPVEGVDIVAGYISADDTAGSGDIMDINVTITMVSNLTLGLEYLTIDKTVKAASAITANYAVSEQASITVRLDGVSYEIAAVSPHRKTTTVALLYNLADNLGAVIEWNSSEAGTTDNDMTTLEFVAKF